MSMEIVTTTDKNQRDRLFEDLRKNGNELERQVVKFSSNEPILGTDQLPKTTLVQYTATGKGGKINYGKPQLRILYRSNWSVAYPTS